MKKIKPPAVKVLLKICFAVFINLNCFGQGVEICQNEASTEGCISTPNDMTARRTPIELPNAYVDKRYLYHFKTEPNYFDFCAVANDPNDLTDPAIRNLYAYELYRIDESGNRVASGLSVRYYDDKTFLFINSIPLKAGTYQFAIGVEINAEAGFHPRSQDWQTFQIRVIPNLTFKDKSLYSAAFLLFLAIMAVIWARRRAKKKGSKTG